MPLTFIYNWLVKPLAYIVVKYTETKNKRHENDCINA
jgi:hypothetical protein